MDIADRTNKLVIIAQQVATSSSDVDLQMEVANAINDVALGIERLVLAFNDILVNSNADTQTAFAAAAKDVGDAINRLCQATDSTSQQKIVQAVHQAQQSAHEVTLAARQSRDKLTQVAQIHVDHTVRLVKVASLAAGSTADDRKKGLLLQGSDRVKQGAPALIQASKNILDKTGDQSQLDRANEELRSAFNLLIEAAKLSPSYFGKLNDTYDYVRRLIDRAKDLEDAATSLYQVTLNGTDDNFVAAAKQAASRALALVAEADKLAESETDPVRKLLIKSAAQELRDASAEMIRAAKAYRENPNDPQRKLALQEAHRRLEAAIRRVLDASGEPDHTPGGRINNSMAAVGLAADRLRDAALNDPAALVEAAQVLAAVALQYGKDAEAYAATLTDEAQRKAVLQDAAEIRNLIQAVLAAAKKVAQNPSAENKAELERAMKALKDRLNLAKKNAFEGVQPTTSSSALNAKSAEAQLVQAAKEEAQAALLLADEADKLAAKMTDPAKRQAIQKAIAEVRSAAQRVMQFAEQVAKNPNDVAAQENLAGAQKDLAGAIEKVVHLTSGAADSEVNAAMQDMRDIGHGAEGDLLKSAQDLLDKIARTFGDPNKKMSPGDVINNAKELSLNAAELARQLREMAAKTTDPVYKEKLLNAAKIIRDGGIQIKILSAVRAAGGEDKGNSVAMAAKGLQTNIQDIIKEVRSESLRNKFRNTVKQTIAINKVVSVWRKKAGK
jgi:hypothetical protein